MNLINSLNVKKKGLTLILIFIPLYMFFLGTPELWEGDEGVHAEFARQMYIRSDWISTYYNYTPRFDKPPLTFWTTTIFYHMFGVTEFASRLTSMLFGLLGIYIVFLFGRRVFNRRVGFIAALMLGSGLLYFLESQMILMDTALTFFISWALYLFYRGYVEEEPKYLLLMGIPVGLGILVKGPVALVLPGGIGLIYAIIQTVKKVKTWRNLLKWKLLFGLITALAVSAPWYIAIWRRHGSIFLESHFGYHMFQRFTTAIESHGGQAWYFYFYYVLIIFFGFMPWSVNIPGALKQLLKERRDDKRLFLICWFFVPFIFFTISQTKLPGYAMTFLPPTAVFIALWLESRFSEAGICRNIMWGIVFQLAVSLVLSLILITQRGLIPAEYDRLYKVSFLFPFSLVLSAVMHWIMCITKRTYRSTFIATFITCYFYLALFLAVLTPVVQEFQPVKHLSTEVKQYIRPNDQVAANILGGEGTPFYLGRRVFITSNADKLTQIFQSQNRVFALVRPTYLNYLEEKGVPYYIVTQRDKGYVIVNQPIE